MANKHANAATEKSGMLPFFNLGQEQAEAAAALQKELLDAYEQTSRAWLARVQSEVALWSDLAARLAATRNFSEALEAYNQCVSQQMRMTAEDGKRLLDDCQQITQKISKSLMNDKSARSS